MTMAPLRIEKLGISKMASGHLCLSLSEEVSWEAYPDYAQVTVKACGGVIKDKIESPEIRIWGVAIAHEEFRLVYDDYPQLVSLESCSNGADALVESLHDVLLQRRMAAGC
jgi:hypothetical protein